MADLFQLESTADVAAGASGSRLGTALDTGVLRRKYDFGDRVSELNIASDPFFRMVSKLAKKPTDDPEFKFTERRPSWHKRYAYVVGHAQTANTAVVDQATLTAAHVQAGSTYHFLMGTDYKSSGNIGSVYGQSGTEISVGDSGTKPEFFLPGQIIKINMTDDALAAGDTSVSAEDYILARVEAVSTVASVYVNLECTIVRTMATQTKVEICSYYAAGDALNGQDISGKKIADYLEPKRCYVVGNSHAQGSGYPETWKDQPFSTGFGRTQIWKTAMAMDNTMSLLVLGVKS